MVYEPYTSLRRHSTVQSIDKFLSAGLKWPSGPGTKAGASNGHTLEEYCHQIDQLNRLRDGVASLPSFAPFNLFILNCSQLNEVCQVLQ